MNKNRSLACAAAAIMLAALMLMVGFSVNGSAERGALPFTVKLPDSALDSIKLLNVTAKAHLRKISVQRPVPSDSGAFKISAALRPKVDFWKWVFGELYNHQAVLHNADEITRIYALIDLREEPGVNPKSLSSLDRAAYRVFERYTEHLRFLTKQKYDPQELTGERRELYSVLEKYGGVRANRGADESLRIQRGLREKLRDSIIRSGQYLSVYRQIFQEHGLPEELALLPHVESSFRHEAHSTADAVGIWQLTSVAVRGKMHINAAVDERRDPWRSAEIAARLLEDNYRTLRSWELAITAYNQGVGTMQAAIKSTGSRKLEDIIARYRSRLYRFVGRNFYLLYVAVVEIVHDYELYFGYLPIEPELQVVRHKLKRQTTLNAFCTEFGVEPQHLMSLNPALRRTALGPSTQLPQGMFINLPSVFD
jgi:membrane-bound lytic murein transglycosylase D